MPQPQSTSSPPPAAYVVVISAGIEWQAVRRLFPDVREHASPLGNWFVASLEGGGEQPILFFHGGWGKIAAAASLQYLIDRARPELVINIGTCGGFAGDIERGTLLLVDRTLVYDIYEQMGDPEEPVAHYTTEIDLDWLQEPYPAPVVRTLLVSGDRDLLPEDIPFLRSRYGAVAGDWESASIAWVASRNGVRCLILRAVSDLVGPGGGEAYGGTEFFKGRCAEIMPPLVRSLIAWIECHRGADPLQLEPFRSEHADAVVAWLSSHAEARMWAGPGVAWPVASASFKVWHRDCDIEPYLLVEAGRPVAYGELWLDRDEREIELARLVVCPKRRGSGIGRRLARCLLERARSSGYPTAFVRVMPDNRAAVACYRAAGFTTVAPRLQEQYNQGQPLDYLWMACPLNESSDSG